MLINKNCNIRGITEDRKFAPMSVLAYLAARMGNQQGTIRAKLPFSIAVEGLTCFVDGAHR